MILLPPELKPFLLDLSDYDKQVINNLFTGKDSELTFAEWSKIVLSAYEEGSLELSDKLAHLVSKIAYFALQYSIPFELSIKYSSSGAKLWWIESLIQEGESERARELLNDFNFDNLSLLEKAEWYNKLANSYLRVGSYSDAVEIKYKIEQFLSSIDDNDVKSILEQTLLENQFAIGWSLLFLGEVKKSTEYAERGIALAKQYQDKILLGYHTLLLGRIKQFQGVYNEASQIYKESYQYLSESGDIRTAMACSGNQGAVDLYQGKYLNAIEVLIPSFNFWVENKNHRNTILTKILIAKAFLGVGNISRAQSHANDAYGRLDESEHLERRFLVDIGFVYLSCNELEKAVELVFQAEELGNEEITKSDLAEIQALKGVIELKKMNLSKAEEYLLEAQIAAVEMSYSNIIIKVMIHLSEISILRYNFTGNSTDISKAEERVTDLESLIRNLNLPEELCKVLLIKAKIAKNQLKIEQAITLSDELIQIASKNEYKELTEIGNDFKEEIEVFYKKKSKKTTKSKINTTTELSEMALSLTSRRFSEEKSNIYALIIIQPEGTPLFTVDFSEDLETDVHNSLLLSGFLRAVTDLSSDIFKTSKKAFLRAIEYIDSTIIIEIEQNVIFSLLVEKETLELRFKLRQLIKEISSEPDFMIYKPKVDPILKNTIMAKVRNSFKSYLEA
ncbi:MAG: hypothetical protein KAR35_05360 [Candidatus Heimdallarchaeota archaeon]|nr:hypothetical protein [Candidatus Heimdallarchaeota archaeon]MCK5048785.1 hypothetical protein [Candidatus Heimdallarchaeota archaeon]